MGLLLAVGYGTAGVVAGLLAARYEYRDGAAPERLDSAGAVGLFVALFWPVVGLVLALGVAARRLA